MRRATRRHRPKSTCCWEWARLEEADHRIARATELLDRAALLQPDHPALRPLRATLLGREGHWQPALAITEDCTLTGEQMLDRGRLLDRAGRYDKAFAAFDAGRAAMRSAGKPQYAAATAAALAARLAGFFTAARLAHLPRAKIRTDGPAAGVRRRVPPLRHRRWWNRS